MLGDRRVGARKEDRRNGKIVTRAIGRLAKLGRCSKHGTQILANKYRRMGAEECVRLLSEREIPLRVGHKRPEDADAIHSLLGDPRVAALVRSGGHGDPRLLSALRLNAMLACGTGGKRRDVSDDWLNAWFDARAALATLLFTVKPTRKEGRSDRDDDSLRAVLERLMYVHRLDRRRAIAAVVERGFARGWWKSRDPRYVDETLGPLIDDVRRLYRRLDARVKRGLPVPPVGQRWLWHAGDGDAAKVLATWK